MRRTLVALTPLAAAIVRLPVRGFARRLLERHLHHTLDDVGCQGWRPLSAAATRRRSWCRATDRLCRRGAPMEYLAHSASLHSCG